MVIKVMMITMVTIDNSHQYPRLPESRQQSLEKESSLTTRVTSVKSVLTLSKSTRLKTTSYEGGVGPVGYDGMESIPEEGTSASTRQWRVQLYDGHTVLSQLLGRIIKL